MDLRFQRDLLERARQDYPDLDSVQKFREWFGEFVDLYEEEITELIQGEGAPARPKPQTGGRKKSMVFNMLASGGGSGRNSLSRGSRSGRISIADPADEEEAAPTYSFGRGRRSSSAAARITLPPLQSTHTPSSRLSNSALQSPDGLEGLNSPTLSASGKKRSQGGRVRFGGEEGPVIPAIRGVVGFASDDSLRAAVSPAHKTESPPFALNPTLVAQPATTGEPPSDGTSPVQTDSSKEIKSPPSFGQQMSSYTAFGGSGNGNGGGDDDEPQEQAPEAVAAPTDLESGESAAPVINFVVSHAFGSPRGSVVSSSNDTNVEEQAPANRITVLRNPSIKFMNSVNSEGGNSDDPEGPSATKPFGHKAASSNSLKGGSHHHHANLNMNNSATLLSAPNGDEAHAPMHKTETMGARLLQKLGKNASFAATHKTDDEGGNAAVEHNHSHESLDDMNVIKPSFAGDSSHPASLVASAPPPPPQMDHVMSTLELKALLTQPQYFTKEQMEKERFHRVSSFIDKLVSDWSIIMIFFTAFTVAARIGLLSSRISPNLMWAELTVDVINFILVIGINMFKPFEEAGHIRTDVRLIVERYVKQPTLAVFDLISNFPVLAILCPLGLGQFEYARVNLLLREVRLPKLFEVLETQLPATLHPSLMRLFSYLMYLLIIVTHLATVFMATLRSENEHDVEAWVELSLDHQLNHDPVFWFIRCWRDMLALITEKHLLYPHEDAEYIVAIILVLLSLMTLAVILASFEEIIVTEIEEGNILGKKIDETLHVLEEMGIEGDLQLEIVEYYQNMWDINRSFDFHSDDMLAELPDMLHDDIEFECNARVIRSIPLFADVAQNPDFVRLLAGELQQIVVMPGGPIVQKGEDGDCMFFLSSGVASVLDEDGVEEVAQLVRGSFFGEVTLLFGGQRDRTINAKTLCVCYVVTDEQFENIVEVYPAALDGILESAVRQMKASAHAVGAMDSNAGSGATEERFNESYEAFGGARATSVVKQDDLANTSFRAFGLTVDAPVGEELRHGSNAAALAADEEMSEEEIRAMMVKRMKFGSVTRRHRSAAATSMNPASLAVGDGEDDEDRRTSAAARFAGAGLQFVFGTAEDSPAASHVTPTRRSPQANQLPSPSASNNVAAGRRGRSKSIGYSLMETCLQVPSGSSMRRDD